MLYIPAWQRILVWAVCAVAIVFALPNVFFGTVERHNDAAAAIAAQDGRATPEQAAALAGWPAWMPSRLVSLGLDLRGGAHLLAEVQVADVYAGRMEALWPEVRDALRAERAVVGHVRRIEGPRGELHIAVSEPAGIDHALAVVRGLARPVATLLAAGARDLEVRREGDTIIVALSEAERQATDDRTIRQSLEIVRRRVDEVGTREPTIIRQGADRIVIQVPGVGSAAELKALIGTTARLTFHPVVGVTADGAQLPGPRQMVLPDIENPGQFYILEATPVVTGEELVDAQPTFDENNLPAVSFRFNPTGARKFGDYTANNIGQLFAIVLDDEVISAPQIRSHIPGGSGIITGRFTVEESTELAVLLRAGALPAALVFLEERTIGPELGADSIAAGRIAALVAVAVVAAFMIASYGLFGVFAVTVLGINIAAILAILSAIGATLTLPGIAGIVLTMGMAVDANVLIYERIREELRRGRTPGRAVSEGFDRALSAILDANVTTLLVAVIMFWLGSGPVRGFAVTLGIGIFTSVFTAVFVTRVMLAAWLNWQRPRTIEV